MNVEGCVLVAMIAGGTVVGIVGLAWRLVEFLTRDKNG